mmetsp:Transcript_22595/g.38616  ORF Transcript_22595/g.38616 Transcript_22595/m.38616 type:complete len:414 (-) Transcript_22595:276-1517(-)
MKLLPPPPPSPGIITGGTSSTWPSSQPTAGGGGGGGGYEVCTPFRKASMAEVGTSLTAMLGRQAGSVRSAVDAVLMAAKAASRRGGRSSYETKPSRLASSRAAPVAWGRSLMRTAPPPLAMSAVTTSRPALSGRSSRSTVPSPFWSSSVLSAWGMSGIFASTSRRSTFPSRLVSRAASTASPNCGGTSSLVTLPSWLRSNVPRIVSVAPSGRSSMEIRPSPLVSILSRIAAAISVGTSSMSMSPSPLVSRAATIPWSVASMSSDSRNPSRSACVSFPSLSVSSASMSGSDTNGGTPSKSTVPSAFSFAWRSSLRARYAIEYSCIETVPLSLRSSAARTLRPASVFCSASWIFCMSAPSPDTSAVASARPFRIASRVAGGRSSMSISPSPFVSPHWVSTSSMSATSIRPSPFRS